MNERWKKLGRGSLYGLAVVFMISATAWFAQSTVTQLSGLAVAENVPTTIWNSVRDGSSGDNLIRGVLASGLYAFDGTNFDRMTGDSTNGLDVDVTRLSGTRTPADVAANPTTLMGSQTFGMMYNGTTWDRVRGSIANGIEVDVTQISGTVTTTPSSVGTGFYAITDTGITTASQNFAFGFTSEKVMITAPSTNATSVCINWLGATAVCAAADTAGDDLIQPGESIFIDNFAGTSISAIVSVGTETIIVRAWN